MTRLYILRPQAGHRQLSLTMLQQAQLLVVPLHCSWPQQVPSLATPLHYPIQCRLTYCSLALSSPTSRQPRPTSYLLHGLHDLHFLVLSLCHSVHSPAPQRTTRPASILVKPVSPPVSDIPCPRMIWPQSHCDTVHAPLRS